MRIACEATWLVARRRLKVILHLFVQSLNYLPAHSLPGTVNNNLDTNDAIKSIVNDMLVDTGYVLCFDEFQVTDIADAMILKVAIIHTDYSIFISLINTLFAVVIHEDV